MFNLHLGFLYKYLPTFKKDFSTAVYITVHCLRGCLRSSSGFFASCIIMHFLKVVSFVLYICISIVHVCVSVVS
ncbi:hypothetical protein Y032_0068g205 [Ancylostoma ceylanicum]|uniref:Uncharacterized protein n=1 Tax=Ancylostoma ceylanicum TaxID=53326 RepID=A0A016TXZ6_9BILA|nr:hypothetical protein Y032_0068g205 [Ancylostoma ceylanicum]